MFVVKPSDKRLAKGSSVKLDCLAAGNPLPTLFWMKEAHGSGILLPGDGQGHVRVSPEGSLVIGECEKLWAEGIHYVNVASCF